MTNRISNNFILPNFKQEQNQMDFLNSEISEINVQTEILPNLPSISGSKINISNNSNNFDSSEIDFGFQIGQEITNYFLKDDILIIDDLEYFDAAKEKQSFLCRNCLGFGKITEAKMKNIMKLETLHCFQCCQNNLKFTKFSEFDLNECEILNDLLFFNGLEFIDPHHKKETYYCVGCLPFSKVTKLNNAISVKIMSDHCQQCYQKRGTIPKKTIEIVKNSNSEQLETNHLRTSTLSILNSDSHFLDDDESTNQSFISNNPWNSPKINTRFRKSDNRNFIIQFYQNNFEVINNFYENLKPDQPLLFNQVSF